MQLPVDAPKSEEGWSLVKHSHFTEVEALIRDTIQKWEMAGFK